LIAAAVLLMGGAVFLLKGGPDDQSAQTSVLPVLMAVGAATAAATVRRRKREAGAARSESPVGARVVAATLAATLTLGLLLWSRSREASTGQTPWIILVFIVTLAVVALVVRQLMRDRDKPAR
jgi:drug/metabolite transporter (DMT)-like permease